MTTTWDRDEALRVAERLEHPRWGMAEEAALLRAADAAIERLRARVEAAEKMAEALRFYVDPSNWKMNEPLDANGARFTGGPARAALAAWDAARRRINTVTATAEGPRNDTDEREALVRLLQIITCNGSLDDGRTLHEVIADALIASGLRLPSDNGDMK